MDPKKYAETPK
jgi:hypothetical protein